nr:MAG TPA: hypothetical protein [Inoviridae sp.]
MSRDSVSTASPVPPPRPPSPRGQSPRPSKTDW